MIHNKFKDANDENNLLSNFYNKKKEAVVVVEEKKEEGDVLKEPVSPTMDMTKDEIIKTLEYQKIPFDIKLKKQDLIDLYNEAMPCDE